jgi:signal peptidase I
MEISVQLFAILSIIYFVTAHFGLYKIFEKLGIEGWKALVPFYSTWIIIKKIDKSIWWFIFYYIPFVGFVVWMGIIVELMKMLGKFSLKEHFLAVVFAPVYLAKVGMDPNIKPIPYEEYKAYKKPKSREWVDAIAFAVVAASLIRMFYIEAFTIPTSSMEATLLRGDFLFVSKIAYGPRVPNTPISFPFAHHTMPGTTNMKSYLEWIKFPYHRLPGFGPVKRNDCVVFNFPEGDTLTLERQSEYPYKQMIRDAGMQILSQQYAGKQAEYEQLKKNKKEYLKQINKIGKQVVERQYHIIERPVDKKENYVKRCVGIAGDTLEIKDAVLYINHKPAYEAATVQYIYVVQTNGTPLNENMLIEKSLTAERIYQIGANQYEVTLTAANAEKMRQMPTVESVEKEIIPKGVIVNPFAIFPNTDEYGWTRDNFGPIIIPKKGMTMKLTPENISVYKRVITHYEHNTLQIKDGNFIINGKPANEYTFKMDYYWMMGDNRHHSQDSRYWGFVPEDHVVGKPVFIWFSYDSQLGKVRWNRIFSGVDNSHD